MEAKDPYISGKVSTDAYAQKCPVQGVVVAVLRGSVPDRGLSLIPQPSRAVRQGEVHELIVTPEDAGPGDRVAQIAYLAFVEFNNGGVILSGDLVTEASGAVLGVLSGYDMSHYPNHMNIVLRGDLRSGEERGLPLGTKVSFAKRPRDPQPKGGST